MVAVGTGRRPSGIAFLVGDYMFSLELFDFVLPVCSGT
jgi:hypothetical protein